MSDVHGDAAPASSEPVPEALPGGTPVDPATIEPPPPVDNAYVAEGAEQFAGAVGDVAAAVDAVAADVHPAVGALERIEALAVQWGGDVMTEIRHLVAEVKSLL